MTTECTKPRITLKTLAIATEQEVFDQVVQHLREQGVQSKNENGCAYRGESGLMCAAGCLIADDEYTSYMDNAENSSWNHLVSEYIFPSEHRDLISDLQAVHDEYTTINWEEGFSSVSQTYNLVYIPPNN